MRESPDPLNPQHTRDEPDAAPWRTEEREIQPHQLVRGRSVAAAPQVARFRWPECRHDDLAVWRTGLVCEESAPPGYFRRTGKWDGRAGCGTADWTGCSAGLNGFSWPDFVQHFMKTTATDAEAFWSGGEVGAAQASRP
jgi:hypothetical protein